MELNMAAAEALKLGMIVVGDALVESVVGVR